MIKIKFGFIARVVVDGFYDPLPKAPSIYEMGSYPEYHIIEPTRAKDFCRRINDALPTDDTSRKFAEDCMREILFDEKQWTEILAAFDGRMPEIILWNIPPMINKKFTHPFEPENIEVKFRLALDENGDQIRAADYIKPIKTARDILVGRVETKAEAWKESQREKLKDIDDWRKIETSKREQMINRLIIQENAIAFKRAQEYEQRIRQMTDEQIEKEYRMEFGE